MTRKEVDTLQIGDFIFQIDEIDSNLTILRFEVMDIIKPKSSKKFDLYEVSEKQYPAHRRELKQWDEFNVSCKFYATFEKAKEMLKKRYLDEIEYQEELIKQAKDEVDRLKAILTKL